MIESENFLSTNALYFQRYRQYHIMGKAVILSHTCTDAVMCHEPSAHMGERVIVTLSFCQSVILSFCHSGSRSV